MVLFMSGCTQEYKQEHALECVIKSVVNHTTGGTVVFTREDAVKNGYEYYNKGTT